MGKFPRYPRYMLGRYTVFASDMDHVENARGGQSQYTDDVYTDARKLCMGRESGSTVRVGRLEYVGNLPCDGCAARLFASHGDYV